MTILRRLLGETLRIDSKSLFTVLRTTAESRKKSVIAEGFNAHSLVTHNLNIDYKIHDYLSHLTTETIMTKQNSQSEQNLNGTTTQTALNLKRLKERLSSG